MGMARGALRPCYSPTRRLRPFACVHSPASIRRPPFARLHSPAFPVVADGAKMWLQRLGSSRREGIRQRPDNGLQLRPGITPANAWLPTHGYPGAGPARPASALTPACLRWWRNLSSRAGTPADRNVNQHPGANSPGPETNTPHFHILPAQESRPIAPRAHALVGAPNTESRGTVARTAGQLADGDLDTSAMLRSRCSHQEYEAQSVPHLGIAPRPC